MTIDEAKEQFVKVCTNTFGPPGRDELRVAVDALATELIRQAVVSTFEVIGATYVAAAKAMRESTQAPT